jgi:hypothetical protein
MATQAQPVAQQAKTNVAPLTNAKAAEIAGTAPAASKPAEAPKAKTPREAVVVKMADGRDVEFVGKRKLLKESLIDEAGKKVSVRLDFRNGKTILFACPDSLLLRAAGHGLEQKLGDETAGAEKVDDMVIEVDDLIERLSKAHDVRALARSDDAADLVRRYGATPVRGDLDGLTAAMVGDAEVVEEILKMWPGYWEDRSDPSAPHEANLLNLATEKAHHLLQWSPVWSFEKTLKATVQWYQKEQARSRDIQKLTGSQIAEYTTDANHTGLPWAQNQPQN